MWIYNFTVTIGSQKNSRTFFVQNLIPYKIYVQEKHVESILGTRKNMTKKKYSIWIPIGLQSRLFLKNIKNFLCKKKLVNNLSIPSMHAEKKNYRLFS
jgi:hypothetical protein